jgi:hypothetical protein
MALKSPGAIEEIATTLAKMAIRRGKVEPRRSPNKGLFNKEPV